MSGSVGNLLPTKGVVPELEESLKEEAQPAEADFGLWTLDFFYLTFTLIQTSLF
jgi:hypothetical protein